MKIRTYIYGLLTAVLGCGMSGCALRDDDLMAEAMRIQLGAEVTSSVLSRVSPNVMDYDVNQLLPITLVRWDEGLGDNVSGKTELSATMGIPATDGTWLREIAFDAPQFYKDKEKGVGFAGWYPASDDEGWVKVKTGDKEEVIDSNHTMTYNLDGTTDVMVSDFARGNFQSGMPALKFHHALSMYKIYVYAVDEECRKTWGELTQVTLSNLHQQLKVQLPATFTGDWEPKYSFSTPQPESGPPTSYKLFNDGAQQALPVGMSNAEEVGTLLHGKPAGGGSIPEGVLYIEAKTTEQTAGVKVAVVRDFKPGYTYNIYLKFSEKGIINADVSATDWEYDPDNEYVVTQDYGLLTDLSRYGTANCYIVSSANRGYCFDATVKGNGVNTLTKKDGTVIQLPDRDVHLDIDEVKILRSDAMMELNTDGKMQPITDYATRVNTPIVELLSNKLTDGKIVFRVPGNKDNSSDYRLICRGNVKIGAYKNGKIVWSWHIWVTDKPQNQGYSNGYVALDRNLGAVTDDYKTFQRVHSAWSGLYYQWGRKDPIFRPTVDENDDWKDVWPRNVIDRAVSVAEAHEKPTAYFWSSTSNDWTTDTENSDYFWGYISVRDDVKKTLYDPCPPGYRVPGNAIWENQTDAMTVSPVSNGTTFAGYEFTIRDMIDIYYPAAACLAEGQLFTCDHNGTHDNTEKYTYLYSATPYDPSLYGQTDPKYKGLAYHFRYNEKSGASSPVLVADPDQYHVKRSAAYPVRCVFENSAPTVTDLSEVQTANSYVVSKSGFYKFRATTRGNGVTGLYVVSNGTLAYRSFDATMGAGISGIDKIDLLWWQGDLSADSNYKTFANGNPSSDKVAAKCPVVILDNGKLEDGFATFYVTVDETTYGNVGLAAYDANGEILWSWHIWIQPEVKVVRLGDYTVMDRNLGATYAPANENYESDNFYANLGLYYQWGRKDPFFPPKGKDNTDNSTDVWFKKENGVWKKQTQNSVSTKNLIPQSVKHPLEFYKSGNSLWQTSFLTLDAEPNDLWGYVGSAGTPGESFAKTMYDPCPPGYRVMQHDVFQSANICSSDNQNNYIISGSNYNSNGIYFKDNMTAMGTISAGGVWFPNSRAINSAGNFVNDNNYRLSTATPYYNPGGYDNWWQYTPPYVNSREMRWSIQYSYYYYYQVQQNHLNNWMADGRVVRCQME